eukprot:jgi/Astpho2/2298/gw1.00040.45.1_t
MLSVPNAYAKMGLAAGLCLSIGSGFISAYTIVLLVHLYEERKRRLVSHCMDWNYHEVITELCGKFLGAVTLFFVMLNVLGITVAQVVACSSDAYYYRQVLLLHQHLAACRTWALIFGAILQVAVFVPTLRHTRVINILGLVGTTYTPAKHQTLDPVIPAGLTCLPCCKCRPPKNLQTFYTGFGVLLVAFGGHSISFEVMDSMNTPKHYRRIGFLAFLYIFTLTVPHSTAVQLVYPTNNAKNGNVFGALPHSTAMDIGITLMILHQICAFVYYMAPLFYLAEKIAHIHHKSMWWKVPVRLPITLIAWLLGVAFPFYGTLNSVIGALTGPIVAFAMPCLAFNITYW